jgi:hypothetical protein
MLIGTFLLTMILISQSVVAIDNYARNVVLESYCTNSEDALGSEDGEPATLGIVSSPPIVGTFVLDFSSDIPGSSDLWIYGTIGALEPYGWRLMGEFGTQSSWTWGCDDRVKTKFTTPANPGGSEKWVAIEIATQTPYTYDYMLNVDMIPGSEIDAVEF